MLEAGFNSKSINPESPHSTSASILNFLTAFRYCSTFFFTFFNGNMIFYYLDSLEFKKLLTSSTLFLQYLTSGQRIHLWENPQVPLTQQISSFILCFHFFLTCTFTYVTPPSCSRCFHFYAFHNFTSLLLQPLAIMLLRRCIKGLQRANRSLVYCGNPQSPDKEIEAQPG